MQNIKPMTQQDAVEYDKILIQTTKNLLLLIEKAGFLAFECIIDIFKIFGFKTETKICVVIGPGNNGSDGLVIAKFLKFLNYNISMFCNKIKHQRLFDDCLELGIPVVESGKTLKHFDLVIDAIFGVGFKGTVSEFWSNVILNFPEDVISIDVPSGYNIDSEFNEGFSPLAVICYNAPKICCTNINTYITRKFGHDWDNVQNYGCFIHLPYGYKNLRRK